jgi:hypothetical protein
MSNTPRNCEYCEKGLNSNKWKSDWHDGKRYETLICECGKKSWCGGSGRNSDNDGLESTIRLVCDVSCSK